MDSGNGSVNNFFIDAEGKGNMSHKFSTIHYEYGTEMMSGLGHAGERDSVFGAVITTGIIQRGPIYTYESGFDFGGGICFSEY